MAKRLLSEELGELTVSFIYSVSSHSKPKKSLQGSFSNNELLGVLLSLHLKKHAFTGFGILGFGGGGSLQAFTWAVYENRQTPTYYVKNWKFS